MIFLLAAALSCLAPGGTMVIKGYVTVPASYTPGSIFAVVAEQGGYWRKVAWECDEQSIQWPRNERLVAVLPDSSRVPCDMLLAMSADKLEPRNLLTGEVLNVSDLHRKPLDGKQAVMLFVRFPGLRTDPVAIEVSQGR